jgi:hypothetical protein
LSTNLNAATLATRPNLNRIEPRLAARRLLIALAAVPTRTPMPGHAWHDLTRTDPRSAMPFAKERGMIHDAIKQGCTTPDRVISYRLAQMKDDLAQFAEAPNVVELVYVQLVTEEAEAVEAQTLAHALPTAANRDAALRETEEASTIARAYCSLVKSGRSTAVAY